MLRINQLPAIQTLVIYRHNRERKQFTVLKIFSTLTDSGERIYTFIARAFVGVGAFQIVMVSRRLPELVRAAVVTRGSTLPGE
jgi:hypothetical protein